MLECQEIAIAGDDGLGLAREGGFDETVVIRVAGDLDCLGWGDHDRGQGQEFDEFVDVADECLQLGVGEHAA